MTMHRMPYGAEPQDDGTTRFALWAPDRETVTLEIERDGGGWYNIAEAHIACSIAQQLVRDSGVAQKDICIMSPFAAQVRQSRG